MAMIGSSSHCPVMMATVPSVAPSAIEPMSPMNICAGCALNHRKAKHAPTMIKHNCTRKICPCKIGDHAISREGAGADDARQAVESVGEVDGVGHADDQITMIGMKMIGEIGMTTLSSGMHQFVGELEAAVARVERKADRRDRWPG